METVASIFIIFFLFQTAEPELDFIFIELSVNSVDASMSPCKVFFNTNVTVLLYLPSQKYVQDTTIFSLNRCSEPVSTFAVEFFTAK